MGEARWAGGRGGGGKVVEEKKMSEAGTLDPQEILECGSVGADRIFSREILFIRDIQNRRSRQRALAPVRTRPFFFRPRKPNDLSTIRVTRENVAKCTDKEIRRKPVSLVPGLARINMFVGTFFYCQFHLFLHLTPLLKDRR